MPQLPIFPHSSHCLHHTPQWALEGSDRSHVLGAQLHFSLALLTWSHILTWAFHPSKSRLSSLLWPHGLKTIQFVLLPYHEFTGLVYVLEVKAKFPRSEETSHLHIFWLPGHNSLPSQTTRGILILQSSYLGICPTSFTWLETNKPDNLAADLLVPSATSATSKTEGQAWERAGPQMSTHTHIHSGSNNIYFWNPFLQLSKEPLPKRTVIFISKEFKIRLSLFCSLIFCLMIVII